MPAPKSLEDRFAELQARLAKLEQGQRNPFANTGMSVPAPGVVQVDSGELRSGNFVHATSGWHLGSDGTAEFKDITLYDLPNSMLASPVLPGVILQTASNYSVGGGSLGTIVSQSASIPDGYTQLLAHSLVFSFVVNPNTTGGSNGSGGDIHELKAYIGGFGGQTTGVSISGSNGQTSVSAGAAVLLTGLTPGGTVLLEAKAGNGFQAFAANPSNVASITATLMWLR